MPKVFTFDQVPEQEKERILMKAAQKGIKDPAEIRVILSDDNKALVTDASNPITTFMAEFAANVPAAGTGMAGATFARAKAAARLKNPWAIGAATLSGAVIPAIAERMLQDKVTGAVSPEAEALLAEGRETNPNAALLGQLSSGFLFGSPFKPGSLGKSRLGQFIAPAATAVEQLNKAIPSIEGAADAVSASKPIQRLLHRFAIPGATQAGVDVASQAAEQGTVDPRKFTLDKKRTALATLTGLLQMNPTAAGKWASGLGLRGPVSMEGTAQPPKLLTEEDARNAFFDLVRSGRSYDEAWAALTDAQRDVGARDYFGHLALQSGLADEAAKQDLVKKIIAIRGGLDVDMPLAFKQLVAMAKQKGQTGVELTPEDVVALWLQNPGDAQTRASLKLSEMDQAQRATVEANKGAALQGEILSAADQINAAKAEADKAAAEATRAAAAPAIVQRVESTLNPPLAEQNAKHGAAVAAYRKAESASIGKEGATFTKEEQAKLNDIARSRELLSKYGEDPDLSAALKDAEARIVEAAKARIGAIQNKATSLWIGKTAEGKEVVARTLAELQTMGDLVSARQADPIELAVYNEETAAKLPKKADDELPPEAPPAPEPPPVKPPPVPPAPPKVASLETPAPEPPKVVSLEAPKDETLLFAPREQPEQPDKLFSLEDEGKLFHGKPQEYTKGTRETGTADNQTVDDLKELYRIRTGNTELPEKALKLLAAGDEMGAVRAVNEAIQSFDLQGLRSVNSAGKLVATMEEKPLSRAANLRGSPAGLPAKPGSVEAEVVRATTPEEAKTSIEEWLGQRPEAQRKRILNDPRFLNAMNDDPVKLWNSIKDKSFWKQEAPAPTREFNDLKSLKQKRDALQILVSEDEALGLLSKSRTPDQVAADLVMESPELGTEQEVSAWLANILNGKLPSKVAAMKAPEPPKASLETPTTPAPEPPKPVASMEDKRVVVQGKVKLKKAASKEKGKAEAAEVTNAADDLVALKAKLKKTTDLMERIALKEKIAALEKTEAPPKTKAPPKTEEPEDFEDVAKFLGYKDSAEMSADTSRTDDVVLRTEDDSRATIGKSKIPNAGEGLFTRHLVAGGETMFPVQIGSKRTYFGTKINHSSKPNAEVVEKGGNLWLKTKHEVPGGAELTIDYIDANALRREYLGKRGVPIQPLKEPGPKAVGIKPAPLFTRSQIGAPFRAVGKLIDAVWTRKFGAITQQIARMPIPEAARTKLLMANQTLQRLFSKGVNRYDEHVYAAMKQTGLTKESVERIIRYADDMDVERGGAGSSPIKLTPEENAALQQLLTAHKLVRFDQNRLGMEVAGRQGGINPWYLNHMIDPDVLQKLRNLPEGDPELLKLKQAWDRRAMQRGGMSQSEADELFKKFRTAKDSRNPDFDIFNPYFAPLVEAQNRMGLPLEWRDKSWNGFLRYMRKAALGIAHWQVTGNKTDPEARALSQLLFNAYPDEKFFDPGSGTYDKLPDVSEMDRVKDLQHSWEALTGGRVGTMDKLNSLGSALYVQFPAKIRDAFGTVATASELFDLNKSAQAFEEVLARAKQAAKAGAIPLRRTSEWMADKDLQGLLTSLSSGIRIGSGNEAMERALRQLAYGLGHWNAEQWVASGNEDALTKLFGHKGWMTLSKADLLEQAGHQAVQRLQGKYGNEGLSKHFFQGVDDSGANAFLRFMAHYTRYSVERANNWRETVWKAAEEGNLKPLLISSGFHVLTGAAYAAFMSALLKKKPQEQTWKEFVNSGRKDVWRWAMNQALPLGWMGMFGWGIQAIINANRNVNVRTPESPLYILANNLKTRLAQAQAARVSDGRDLIDLITELGWTLMKDNFQNVNSVTFEDKGQRDERMFEQSKGNIKYVPQGITDNPFSAGAVLRNENTSDEKAARVVSGYFKARGDVPKLRSALRSGEYYKFIEKLRGKEESREALERDKKQELEQQRRLGRAARQLRRD